MYNENSYKKHIFWIKAKRVFFIILFTIIGTALGVVCSSYIIDILLFNQELRPIIIIVSALIFLFLALLLTANTGKLVQDGYWKIAVFEEITKISEKLDNLENLSKLEQLEKLNELDNLKLLKNINSKHKKMKKIKSIKVKSPDKETETTQDTSNEEKSEEIAEENKEIVESTESEN